jgi:peptide/nickel transport system ATP-binding protein
VGSRDLPLKEFRRQVQMVFQDSYASLNPRLTIEDSIAFGPQVHGVSRKEAVARAHHLMDRVRLAPARFAERYPHELSGGQRQRINIARALALQPRMVILDEAVSALDKSVEAQVLNLLPRREFGLTYVFISHDLGVVHYISDRVMVMYLGQVAEIGPSDALFAEPAHPYTKALLSSVPSMDPPTARSRRRWQAIRPIPSTHPAAAATAAPRPMRCAQLVPGITQVQLHHSARLPGARAGSGHPLAPAAGCILWLLDGRHEHLHPSTAPVVAIEDLNIQFTGGKNRCRPSAA